jgi:N6-adenosine-specific RNA methylase IME4
MTHELKIDKEFAARIPPLSGEKKGDGVEETNTAIEKLSAAKKFVMAAQKMAEIEPRKGAKMLRDGAAMAEAAKRIAKSVGLSLEVQNEAAGYSISAQRALGQLIPNVCSKGGDRKSNARGERLKLTDLGIEHNQSSRCQLLASLPEREIEEYKAECAEKNSEVTTGALVTKARRQRKEEGREEKRTQNAEKVAATTSVETLESVFSTIVIDPPWDWGDEGDCDQHGRARPTYKTMSIEELLDLPVGKLAEENAHLYLWITNRSLPKGFALLERWGFRYITCLTWCKPSFGMGNYFRGQTEQVLFGVRGSMPMKRHDVGTWFSAERGKGGHSSKPLSFLELVESCSHGPYLEMFSRSKRNGWTAWGADA